MHEWWNSTSSIAWEFANDEERKLYEFMRRPLWRDFALIVGVLLPCSAMLYAIYGSGSLFFPVCSLVVLLALPGYRWFLRMNHELTGVEVHLYDDRFEFRERFGDWNSHLIAGIRRRHIRSAHWASDGLEFVVRPAFNSRVVISYHHLFADHGITKLQAWCDRLGITIDGVPPLPDGYKRQVEEKRGL